jgi:hypothetical protein
MAPTSEMDALLRRGPGNLPVSEALHELRYKILVDGIPSNSDGMVCLPKQWSRWNTDCVNE